MPSANGSGEKMLKVLAKKYGLQLPGDITMVYLGAEAAGYVAAFQNKLVDAALPFEPAGVRSSRPARDASGQPHERRGAGVPRLDLHDGHRPP